MGHVDLGLDPVRLLSSVTKGRQSKVYRFDDSFRELTKFLRRVNLGLD